MVKPYQPEENRPVGLFFHPAKMYTPPTLIVADYAGRFAHIDLGDPGVGDESAARFFREVAEALEQGE